MSRSETRDRLAVFLTPRAMRWLARRLRAETRAGVAVRSVGAMAALELERLAALASEAAK